MKILVINGPNINMLGIREPAIYGDRNYETLINQINVWGAELHAEVECYQSNHEGDIVDKIQDALGKFDGIVINPAAYTHTSVAILDALKGRFPYRLARYIFRTLTNARNSDIFHTPVWRARRTL